MAASVAATVLSVQSAIAAAQGAGITAAGMVALLDLAIAAPASVDGQIMATYSIAGRSVSLGLRDALDLRKYYHELAKDDASGGGFIVQPGEFSQP